MKLFERKLILGTTLLLSLVSLVCDAALPPFYQSLREYKTLINSQELTDRLNSADLILDISRDDHTFTVTTLQHRLKVDVVYDPPGHQGFVGPAQYHLVFHEAEPISPVQH